MQRGEEVSAALWNESSFNCRVVTEAGFSPFVDVLATAWTERVRGEDVVEPSTEFLLVSAENPAECLLLVPVKGAEDIRQVKICQPQQDAAF